MEAEPLDIVHDILHILSILLGRVRVVESEVTDTSIILCYTEVHANRLGMSDMYITVGLWWETSLYSSSVLTCGKVALHHLLYKTETLLLLVLSQTFLFSHDVLYVLFCLQSYIEFFNSCYFAWIFFLYL